MECRESPRPWVEKPLGRKCYGSIGHLPGSRLGPGDHKICEGQARIALNAVRDKHDVVIVQEKLDGSNVGVARINGVLVPLIRAGYPAISSSHLQHVYFAKWVFQNQEKFDLIPEGTRICGEWLAQVHSIRYQLNHDPFVAFDMIREGEERLPYELFSMYCDTSGIQKAHLLHKGGPFSIEDAEKALGVHGHHGAIDPAEGAVWRVERKCKVDFLGKYVRASKKDGEYFDNIQWNWRPE